MNNAANDDDIKNGTKLATVYGIKITSPKFGVSTDRYMFDPNQKVISKGISSVKYLNKTVPSELYEMYHSQDVSSFMNVLIGINEKTSCDERQLTNLIRIGYFSEYGNEMELLRIKDVFNYFKKGKTKIIKKSSIKNEALLNIIAAHSSDKNAKGETTKSFRITDMGGLLHDCERYVLSIGIKDSDVKSKIANQLELLGYVDITTNREADRRKLLVLDLFNLKSGSEIWGVSIIVRSLGTGNEARLTISKSRFDETPLKKMDVIYGERLSKNRKGYWYLNEYRILA